MTAIAALAGIFAAEVLGGAFFTVAGIHPSAASFLFLAIMGAAAGASGSYLFLK